MIMTTTIEFEECFHTGIIDFEKNLSGRGAAISSALTAWAACMVGAKIPEKFGQAMVRIGIFLGEPVSDTNRLKEMADEWIYERDCLEIDKGES
jgi:hypothetical protein